MKIRKAADYEYDIVRSFYHSLIDGMGFRYVGTLPMFYEDTGWKNFLLYEYLI